MRLFLSFLFIITVRYTWSQEVIPYLDGDQYGYSTLEGEMVIEPQFEEASFFDDRHMAHVRKGKDWSLINREGVLLLPYTTNRYEYLSPVFNSNKAIPMADRKKNKLINVWAINGRNSSLRMLNPATGRHSEIFSPYREGELRTSGIAPVISFFNGLYIGRISDTNYHVLDTLLNLILVSKTQPRIQNDSLITYVDQEQTQLYNIKTQRLILIPHLEVERIIEGRYCIVSNVRISTIFNAPHEKIIKKVTLTDLTGTPIFKRNYDNLHYDGGSILLANSGDTTYLLDFNEKSLASEVYRTVYYDEGEYLKAKLLNDHWVLLDSSGQRALPGEYEVIEYYKPQEYYNVTVNQTTALLDKHLRPVISCKGQHLYKTNAPDLFHLEDVTGKGILNAKGKIIVPAIYDECYPIGYDNFFRVTKNQKSGLLRRDGSMMLDITYDEIEYRHGYDRGFIVAKSGMYSTCYDDWGNLLGDSLTSFQVKDYGVLSVMYNDTLCYLTDTTGHLICPAVRSVRAERIETDSSIVLILKTSDETNVVRTDGTWIIPPGMTMGKAENQSLIENGWFSVASKGKEGIIDHYGKWIIPLSEQHINFISAQFYSVQNGKYTYLYRTDGSRISHQPYDEVLWEVEAPMFEVKRDQKTGYVGHDGTEIIPVIYDQAFFFADRQIAEMTLGKVDGQKTTVLYDTLGHLLLRTSYDDLYPLNDPFGYYSATLNHRQSIIDLHGNIILPPIYNWARGFADTTFFSVTDESRRNYLLIRKGEKLFERPDFPTGHIPLPEHRYVLLFESYSLIVDQDGKTLQRFESNAVEKVYEPDYTFKLLRVIEGDFVYYFNAKTLQIYRNEE